MNTKRKDKIMGKLLDNLKAYLESEEGKKHVEKMNQEFRFDMKLKKRYLTYFHNLSDEEKTNIINKIIEKYSSEKYRDRELKCGRYEPRELLYDYIFDYGLEYGIPVMEDPSMHFPAERYDLFGKFIVEAIYGQGTIVRVYSIADDEIVVHDINEKEVKVYSNKDELIITTNNHLVLTDIRLQIQKKKLEGYYFVCDDEKIEINNRGMFPKGTHKISETNIKLYAELLKGSCDD